MSVSGMSGDQGFEAARQVADALLFEGYVLYPYRASAAKNQVRFQFGVLAPAEWAEVGGGGGEYPFQQTQLLFEADDEALLDVRLRFLQVQAKEVETGDDGAFTLVEKVTVDGTTHITWDEAIEHNQDLSIVVGDLLAGERLVPVSVPGGEEAEPFSGTDPDGAPVTGRVRRTRQALSAGLLLRAERLDGPFGAIRLTVRTDNTTPYPDLEAPRRLAMRYSLVACHTLLALTPERSGRFISALEPPEWAKLDVAGCESVHTYPVLIGRRDLANVVLSSPIILYDYPQIAPESPGDLFDATEIDEILILRTMTLTDAEKDEARATDPRSRAIIDRVDEMPPELLDRLHGAVRYLRGVTGEGPSHGTGPGIPEFGTGSDGVPVFGEHRPFGDEFDDRRPASDKFWADEDTVNPDTDVVHIAGVPVVKGSKVILRPGARRSDVQDMFLSGKVADVQAVFSDLEEKQFLAVTLEEDPNADIQVRTGRFLYFSPDEVVPVEVGS